MSRDEAQAGPAAPTLAPMSSLLVAAGGGGDALAALVVHRLLGEVGPPAAVMTFAWERLRVDLIPGPRSIADFRGLTSIGHHNALVTGETRPVPPSGSTLPRLAAEIDVPLLLLDPSHGAVGLRRQVTEAAELLEVDAVHVVDVGGDILAVGDEPDLRSPLADTLALCACIGLDVPTDVLVAGPGLDGELTADYVRERVSLLRGHALGSLDGNHVSEASAQLEWHPSEATALLVAAAQGMRGTVELRDNGTPLTLDAGSAAVYRVDANVLAISSLLAQPLMNTSSQEAAESVVRHICGSSEIDYERNKRDRLAASAAPVDDLDVDLRRVSEFLGEASSRDVDYVTVRRMAEAVAVPSLDVEAVRRALRRIDPSGEAAPLWRTHHTARTAQVKIGTTETFPAKGCQ